MSKLQRLFTVPTAAQQALAAALASASPVFELTLTAAACRRTHAAAVLHCTHMILQVGGLQERLRASPIQLLSCYIAAAIHDFEHR